MDRREFLAASAAAAALSMVPAAGRAAMIAPEPTFFDWKPVAGPVWAGFGQGGNSTLIVGKEVSYLFDTKNAPFGATLRREVQAKAPGRLVLINTHHHSDHTGGNHAFAADHTILAHEKALPRIPNNFARYISGIKEAVGSTQGVPPAVAERVKADRADLYKRITDMTPKNFMPTEAVGDSRTLASEGGATVHLRQFGPGHTDNDLVTHIPEHNVVIAGDLLFRRLYPYVDPDGGGNTVGWCEALRHVIALCDAKTKVIPGHGEVCSVDALKEQIEYFEKIRAAVSKAMKEGKDRKAIVTMKVAFPGYANEDRQSMSLAAVYHELSEKP